MGFSLSLYLFNLEGSKLCGEIVVVVGMLYACGFVQSGTHQTLLLPTKTYPEVKRYLPEKQAG